MRKVHVVMFGSQIIINIVFSLVLFNGLLGGNGIFAFVYPIFVFVYLLADIIYILRTQTLWEPAPLALMPDWESPTSLASSLEAEL